MKITVIGCGTAGSEASRALMSLSEDIAEDIHLFLYDTNKVSDRSGGLAQYLKQWSRKVTVIAQPTEIMPDLAVVSTPSSQHLAAARQFISLGIPVYVEKPLCLSFSELDEFERAAQAGAWICVGQNTRFLPNIRMLSNVLRHDKIFMIHAWKYRHRDNNYYDGWHGKWATDGGVLSQQAEHCVDLICWLKNKPPNYVFATTGQYKHNIEAEDTVSINMEFADGIGIVSGTTACGEEGTAGIKCVTNVGEFGLSGLYFENIDSNTPTKLTPTEPLNIDKKRRSLEKLTDSSVFKPILKEVLMSLRQGGPPPVTVESGAMAIRTIHAAYASAYSGRKEKYGVEFKPLGKNHHELLVAKHWDYINLVNSKK